MMGKVGLLLLALFACPVLADVVRVDGLNFDKVQVLGNVEVEIIQGESYELTIRGNADDLAIEPFEMTGDGLVLGYSREYPDRTFRGLKYRVQAPTLDAIILLGPGMVYVRPIETSELVLNHMGSGTLRLFDIRTGQLDITAAGSGNIEAPLLSAEDFALAITGSGDIHFGHLDVQSLDLNIVGSGDVSLQEGSSAQWALVDVAGSGDANFSKLSVQDIQITIIGSGNVSIGQAEMLDASIFGSGDISYTGSARIEQVIIGSGALIKRKH
ncbi:MAG: GIN domain-containing protein [Parahaliea sp.]